VDQQKDNWEKSNPKLTDSAMRSMAVAELKKIKGMQNASRKAKDAHDTIYQEENFNQFAAQNRYTVLTTEFFPLNRPPREFSNISDFTKKLLDLQKNEISPVMSDENGYYVFQLVEKKPSHIPLLKDVEPRLKPIFIAVRAQRLAESTALAILNRLKKGEDWQKVCTDKGLKISETGLFVPGEPIPQIGASQEMSDSLLQLTTNAPYPEKPFLVEGNAYILRFMARGGIDLVDYEARKDNLKRGLLRFKQEDVIRSWLEANKAAMIKDGRLKLSKDVKDL
jgi:peptidyl-prolyl cis-trans isomerase D